MCPTSHSHRQDKLVSQQAELCLESKTINSTPFSHGTFTELQNGFESSSSKPSVMGWDTFYQTRLLKSPSSLTFNSARDRAFTASLGSQFQCLTTLTVKNCLLILNLNLSSSSLRPLLLLLSHPCVSCTLSLGIGRCSKVS